MALGLEDNPRISLQGYMAITSNSLQFGAEASLYAEAAGFNVSGQVGFDALIVFQPFYFINPIAGLLTLYHEILYLGQIPSLSLLFGVTGMAVVVCTIGYAVFNRYASVYAEIV